MAAVEGAAAAIRIVAERLEAEADEFRALDAEVGDGDLGVTVAAGCAAVREALAGPEPDGLGELLGEVGRAFAGANPSTMANLVGVGMRRASRAAGEAAEPGAAGWAELLGAAIAGIEKRGGAAVGDKTILDALDGSRRAMEALGPGADAVALAAAASEGAAEAAASIRELPARAGRASWQGERTRGLPDPGAELWAAATRALREEVSPGG